MGQKIHPKILRLGVIYDWDSHWFGGKQYSTILLEDYHLRKALMTKLRIAGVSKVEIDRSINSVKVTVYVARPGIVIGRAGSGLEDLKKFLVAHIVKQTKPKTMPKIDIRVEAIKEPNLDAYLVGQNISDQLIKRLPAKRVLKQMAERVMTAGAQGVRVVLSGRIGGAEISRREKIQQGTVPLSTIREHVQFASVPSLTKKGYIGVKVWINKKEEAGN